MFWDVTLWRSVNSPRPVKGSYNLHHLLREACSFYWDWLPLKMKSPHSSVISVIIYQSTRCNILSDLNLQSHCSRVSYLRYRSTWLRGFWSVTAPRFNDTLHAKVVRPSPAAFTPRNILVLYTGCFTTLGHNCRRWFPRSLCSKKFT